MRAPAGAGRSRSGAPGATRGTRSRGRCWLATGASVHGSRRGRRRLRRDRCRRALRGAAVAGCAEQRSGRSSRWHRARRRSWSSRLGRCNVAPRRPAERAAAGATAGLIRAALAAASFASFSALAVASAAASASATPCRCSRTFSATSTGIELECVFFSVTPYPANRSMIAFALTSSSRASSLIRTWFGSVSCVLKI